MTPEELADLAHLRRARDLIDREYARPLDVDGIARAALMSPAHFSRRFRAAYGAKDITRPEPRVRARVRIADSDADSASSRNGETAGALAP